MSSGLIADTVDFGTADINRKLTFCLQRTIVQYYKHLGLIAIMTMFKQKAKETKQKQNKLNGD